MQRTARQRRDELLERHLRKEAVEGELLVARLRIVVIAILLLLQLGLFALTEEPSFNLILIAVAIFGLLYAGFVLLAVTRGLYRHRTPYTTTATDIVLLTGGVALSTAASGDMTGATKGLIPPIYFLIVILSSLRLDPRAPILAGLAAGTALLLLVVPVALLEPQRVQWSDFRDSSARVVSPIRVGVTAVELVLAGAFLSAGVRYARRAIRRSLHTVTFMFADLRGFTSLTERLGDDASARLVEEYRALVRAELRRFGGEELKTEGDSLLAEFTRAQEAVRCGLAVLERARQRNLGSATPMDIGIGVHSGEPVILAEDYIGSAVNIAARLGQAAGAGELLVSDVVRGLTRTGGIPPMVEREDLALKGVTDVRCYSVGAPS